MLFSFLVSIFALIFDAFIFKGWTQETGPFELLFTLVFFIPQLSVAARRLHDINKSGWWQMLPVLPLILFAPLILTDVTGMVHNMGMLFNILGGAGLIGLLVTLFLVIVWYCKESDTGPNRFGENPKAVTSR